MALRALVSGTCLAALVLGGVEARAQNRPVSLEDAFRSPSIDARPRVRWWWPGAAVEPDELRREIVLLDDQGFGGAEIQSLTSNFVTLTPQERAVVKDYAEPRFFAQVKVAAGAAVARGMTLDYTLGSSWPSGGGFAITPEKALVELTMARTEIAGGVPGPVRVAIPVRTRRLGALNFLDARVKDPAVADWRARLDARARIVAVVAVKGTAPDLKATGPTAGFKLYPWDDVVRPGALDTGTALLLTDKLRPDGTLDWAPPPGIWQVLVYKQYASDMGVLGAAGRGPQLVLDHMNPGAFAAHAARVAGQLGDHPAGIRSTFVDSLELMAAALSAPASAQQGTAQGWISHAAATPEAVPVVLHFRRTVNLGQKPTRYPVSVTADNRYVLYVNGRRAASGPSTGDIAHWREAKIDLAPYLHRGRNIVAAVIWNGVKPLRLPPNATPAQIGAAQGAALFSQTAPSFQQSVATGFRLIGNGAAQAVSTDRPGWRVKIDSGHSFSNGWAQVKRWYYVAGQPETIDAAAADFDWTGPIESGSGWQDAVPAPAAAARTLVVDTLPPQRFRAVSPGVVVRSDLAGAETFPRRPVTVPANSRVKLLLRRDAMLSAYPELEVSGGKGAAIRLTYSEALYDDKFKKADRTLVGDRTPFGPHDTFLTDGGRRALSPLWWRTWRYAEIEVTTKDAPLTLVGMRAYETGYPFTRIASFESDDPALQRIFEIGWRTAEVDAHETYMDTAFWEQLQYAGDTRLQMLISYAVAGDPRLAEQAIDAFAASRVDGGLMEGAYPSRTTNVIAPFSLLWVGMLDDWRLRQPDPAPIRRNLGRMREVLDWFEQWQRPSGLLGKNPHWNFIDWVGQSATDRDIFPSWGKTGESCLMSVTWLGALQQGARIEAAFGDAALGRRDAARAARLAQAIRTGCWSAARGLFADNPDLDRFSQHMNAMAVLYDVAGTAEARTILDSIVAPGKGIDPPEGITPVSYYFAWYLIQAHVHAGLADRYLGLLDTWRGLLALHYTTWPEERGDTRSDSHAWSAHPTADLLSIVAGIGPAGPGYARLRVAPALGSLRRLNATAGTPKGPVRVSYRVAAGRLIAEIERPASLPGVFVWAGRTYSLTSTRTRLVLPVR